MRGVGINLFLAAMWVLLSPQPTAVGFVVGYLIGFALLAIFSSVSGSEEYVRRVLAFVRFALRFAGEFLVANAKVAWAVLFRRRSSLHPGFVSYDVSGLSRGEILLLSYCVSLTPGTTTVEIAPDFRTLILHALDADRPESVREAIDRNLKAAILAFTR